MHHSDIYIYIYIYIYTVTCFGKHVSQTKESKSVHVTFTTRRETRPPVRITRRRQVSRVAPRHETYLAQTHIHKTEAAVNDAYRTVLTIWMEIKSLHKQQNSHLQRNIRTNVIQLWGMASTINIEIQGRFQSKVFRMIVDAPWYVPNTVIRRDLQTPTVK
jgi:hypothetical protein